MSVSNNKTRAIISLEKDLKAKIDELAKKDDRSFSNYVVQILKEHIRKIESENKI